MNRIYHPYWLWEDYRFGMYGKPKKGGKQKRIEIVIECLGNPKVCDEYMERIINEWKYSCEYRLSNTSINRVAWIGQASMCLYSGIKESETREGWWLLTEEQRDKANEIAKEKIKKWEVNHG